jgi:hypothetical protein
MVSIKVSAKTVKVTTNPDKAKDLKMTFYDKDQKEGAKNIGGLDATSGGRKVCTVEYTAFVQELLHSKQIVEV